MNISGTWKIQGWNSGADRSGPPSYSGIVEAQQTAEGCYALMWTVGEARSQQPGIAVHDAESGAFAAAYVMGAVPGVVIYRPGAAGDTLEGLWTTGGTLKMPAGFEEWRR